MPLNSDFQQLQSNQAIVPSIAGKRRANTRSKSFTVSVNGSRLLWLIRLHSIKFKQVISDKSTYRCHDEQVQVNPLPLKK